MYINHDNALRPGHTLMELVVAMVASAVLLAGLGSVMLIGSQVAYTPSAAVRRTETAEIVNQIAEELRYATLVIGQTPQILEFVVADRDGDGDAERIRYEWSGTPGEPLYRSVNGGEPVTVLDSVHEFQNTFSVTSETDSLSTTIESAESLLFGTTLPTSYWTGITATYWLARAIDPVTQFPASIGGINKSDAIHWNATRVLFVGKNVINPTVGAVAVQIRAAGDPNNRPTSDVLGEVWIPENQISSNLAWNIAQFAPAVQGLSLNRGYSVVWEGDTTTAGNHVLLTTASGTAENVSSSTDAGGSWELEPLEVYFRLYGTYVAAGTTYNVMRDYVSLTHLVLQSSDKAHARIDASVPLVNAPELLSSYWRADFDADPTATDGNGDGAADWAVSGGGSFDGTKLIGGVWNATGALETRPLSDFTLPTFVEVSCRNTTVGGNGAVVRINADRQGGLYAPLLVYVQRQADGTQTLSLLGKTSDAATKVLFTRSHLADDFVRFRLTILPQYDVVNLQIDGEDQGSFTYPTYATVSTSDRFLTLYGDTSLAEFDYVEVRVADN
jgi:hypothetical protein